jgi:PAS domain S-box-containing protein
MGCDRLKYMDNNPNEDLKKIIEEQDVIFNTIPAWIFYKDQENRFVRVNKAFCEAMGKTKDELEGKSLFDIYPKDQADNYWKDDKEVMASGKSKLNILESRITPKGQRWVQTYKIPYLDKQGKVIGIIGYSNDITELKTTEEATGNSQFLLQGIIDLLPVRIFWKDINLKYLGCNKVFAKDAGKETVEEIIGKDDLQMSWGEQAQSYRKDDTAVITSGIPKLDYEEEQTTPTGSKIHMITNKVPLKNKSGEIVGVLGTYLDNTERKNTDDKLKNALEETKKMNELMVNREMHMIELKKKILELENKIKTTAL